MRILFVAMAQSIHTARWINQIADEGWEIHLFPSWDLTIHPKLRNIIIHGFKVKPPDVPDTVRMEGVFLSETKNINGLYEKIASNRLVRKIRGDRLLRIIKQKRFDTLKDYSDEDRCLELARVIKKVQPDIIHSLEIQHSGYLTLNAKKIVGPSFPKWIVTNWGADIHHFGELPEHADKIRETLEACDYYGCECQRDVTLGRKFGFTGEVLPVLTNTGGFDFDYVNQFKQPGSTSERKVILLKGYQGWVYRALIGLQAIEKCAEIVRGNNYKVIIYLASPGVPEAAKEMERRTGIPVEIIPYSSHERMLQLHGQARVSIGLSMSDAISTSFLEAIVMGSFPIQSCTSCANEWITDGVSGILVPPEDPNMIAAALTRALTDNELVDTAARLNMKTLRNKLDYEKVQNVVVGIYKKIASGMIFE